LQASQIALRNHQKVKIEALQNAILNTVLNSSIDDFKALYFTNLIDTFTPLHIQLLHFLDSSKIHATGLRENGKLRKYKFIQ
jgi:hypothetical protein